MLLHLTQASQAQSMADIASIRVDELSDSQIRELVKRAEEAGISDVELIQMAKLRGLPEDEAEKLERRIQDLELSSTSSRSRATASKREPRRQIDISEISQNIFRFQQDGLQSLEEKESRVFGAELFYNKNRRLSFEPSLNIATPKNYVLGAGDMVYVDIYGESEQYYEATVNADGFMILDNIGPISVSGKTIEEATGIIRNRLANYYTGIRGSNPSTFVQVTLGNVRTIQVHLVGELRLPGTFTLSAFSTVFNALYSAGGPNENGSMRSVRVIRNGQQIATIDIYDFLVNGKASLDFQLQDQDVVLVDPFIARASVKGEVKRPKIFEIKEGETFEDLLRYSGGFTDEAFKDRVNVTRISGKERAVSDIFDSQFGLFLVKGGDEYFVGKVLDRYSNRVQIKGAVFREGNYGLTPGLTLKQLIQNADGVRGDAYLERASILRTNEDLSTEVLTVNLQNVLNGTDRDIPLKREDVVRIASIYDLNEEFYVQINGEVKNPGTYPYSRNMSVEELILMAGGLREAANTKDVEIARRSQDTAVGAFSQLLPVKLNADLTPQQNPTSLEPFDMVTVRRKPNFTLDKLVQVEGQVNSPGIFSVRSAEERVSEVIQRAGGLTRFAYPKGATLIRRTEFYDTESEQIRRQRNLLDLQQKLLIDPNNTEAQELLLERLFKDLDNNPEVNKEGAAVAESRKDLITGIAERRPDLAPIKIKQTEAIAIDLEAIMRNPGSDMDLILEEGDIISVPKQLQTVRLRGDVVYPATVRFEKERGMKYYINRAGGFDNRANRKRTYIVYANGEVRRTKSFLGIRVYPSVTPGSEIIVPTKGPRIPIRPGELVGITTGLATLVLVITQINP
ncbi:putative polysialic acid transport protein [Indibacter alkaliphilus LW1]|uniref:Polysialic acid transport protein n=1 Tax=Indibacter alkaliphilus (strain CCUG 57479 / KCTC 22604 / LW1) TaxID=1189612 RepID=S2DQA9_INDAL|nr:putative polysialic acid transport protein [Indibacter alkaliphilus LW1]